MASKCAGFSCLTDTTRTDDYPGVDITVENKTTGTSVSGYSRYGPGTDYTHLWSATVAVQPGRNMLRISAYDHGGKGTAIDYQVYGGS